MHILVNTSLAILITLTLLPLPSFSHEQVDAPGVPVIIPIYKNFSWWDYADKVSASFGYPAGSIQKVPAVLILHGGGGVDGRGAFYAVALQEAGIATLEITMFPPRKHPRSREGVNATMPHAAAALQWLAAQPNVDGKRLGVMGFSWGGEMSVLMSSELVQDRMGKDVPKPIAFAPFYPTCSNLVRLVNDPRRPFYNAHKRMSATPMLIQVGTHDDYELSEHPCDALVAMWPLAAREHVTVRYIEGATHDFDTRRSESYHFYDESASGNGSVKVVPSPKDAAEARQTVVSFFITYLRP